MSEGSTGNRPAKDPGRRSVRVSLTFEDFRSFITQYASHISMGGMFISTRSPLPPGTTCKLDVKLKDGYQLIEGLSEVAWTRERAEGPDRPPGMGLRFRELAEQSRDLIFEIVDRRLVEGGSVFQLDKAGEPLPQDIPELEDLLRRAEQRREEARQAEAASEGDEDAEVAAFGEGLQWIESRDDADAVDSPEEGAVEDDGAEDGEDGEEGGEAPFGSMEIDLESLDLEAEEEEEHGDETSLTWTSGDLGQASLPLAGEEVSGGRTASGDEDGGADLDALLAETETPAGPPTEELEAFTAADQLTRHDMTSPDLSALLGSTPGKAGPGVLRRDDPIPTSEPLGDELSSPNLSDFLGDTGERPVLPSEVLASSPRPAWPGTEEEADSEPEPLVMPASRAPTHAYPLPPTSGEEDEVPTERSAGSWVPSEPNAKEAEPVSPDSATTPLSMEELRRQREKEEAWAVDPQREPPLGEILGDRDPGFDPPMGRSVQDDSGVSYHAPTDSRRPLILIVASILLVAAVAGVYFWMKQGDGSGTPPAAVAEQAGEQEAQQAAQQAAQQEEAARPADPGPPAPEVVPVSPSGSPGEEPEGPEGQGGAQEAPPPAAEPRSPPPPARAAPPASPAAAPMTRVQGIKAERTAGGTLVTLSLDGALTQERYNFTRISAGSPRFLLRILRVETGSHPEQVSVRTDEVDRVRTGYHGVTSGQDLHVVLDLAAPTVTVERVESRGRELLIWAESR